MPSNDRRNPATGNQSAQAMDSSVPTSDSPSLCSGVTQGAQGADSAGLDPTRDSLVGSGIIDPRALGATHFIGIGGAGMSVLAEMLHETGVQVSGSDRQASEKTERLEKLGITVHIGQKAENVLGARTVVWSSAIKPDNPEILAARAQGSRILHRSDILALLMASRRSVTVAGAHGKTTTSALTAHILTEAGTGRLADPSYAIGSSIQSAQGAIDGGHVGQGDVLVAEADESDGSFSKYHPTIAIVTNVEPDHLDHYGTPTAFRQAFVDHARRAEGYLVICGDDQGGLDVLRDLDGDCRARIVVYSTGTRSQLGEETLKGASLVRIVSESEASGSGRERCTLRIPSNLLDLHAGGSGTDTGRSGGSGDSAGRGDSTDRTVDIPVELAIPGLHNARNAAAAIIACTLLGMDPQAAARAAGDFRGASRRFEVRGEIGGVTLVDDYAHHPTEIAALLDAARRRYPNRVIRVLFQPHLFSRTRIFADQFAAALSRADDVTVTGIFPARERQEDYPEVGPDTILRARRSAKAEDAPGHQADFHACEDMNQAALDVADRAQPGDVIITVGAGDITTMGQVILDRLASRSEGRDRREGAR